MVTKKAQAMLSKKVYGALASSKGKRWSFKSIRKAVAKETMKRLGK